MPNLAYMYYEWDACDILIILNMQQYCVSFIEKVNNNLYSKELNIGSMHFIFASRAVIMN